MSSPKLCDQLGEARDRCEADVKKCDEFVAIAEKMFQVYDCVERDGMNRSPIFLAPAIYLCDTVGVHYAHENAVRVLSTLKSKKAGLKCGAFTVCGLT